MVVAERAAVVEAPFAGPVGVGGGEDRVAVVVGVDEPAGHPAVVTDEGGATVGDGEVGDVADGRVTDAEGASVAGLEGGPADRGAVERGDAGVHVFGGERHRPAAGAPGAGH